MDKINSILNPITKNEIDKIVKSINFIKENPIPEFNDMIMREDDYMDIGEWIIDKGWDTIK